MAQDMQKYWPIRHELAMGGSLAIKDKRVIIPSQLQLQMLKQLHSNSLGIEKTRMLAGKLVCLVNMNADVEKCY